MSNELQKHKTGDKIKWILTLIAFILVGVMLTGVICGWFEKKEPAKDDTNIEQENPDTGKPDEGGTMITDVVAQSMSLMSARVLEEDYENYGVDALSVENVYTLSVTYTPADTTIKDTTYTIAFENPSSTWATAWGALWPERCSIALAGAAPWWAWAFSPWRAPSCSSSPCWGRARPS